MILQGQPFHPQTLKEDTPVTTTTPRSHGATIDRLPTQHEAATDRASARWDTFDLWLPRILFFLLAILIGASAAAYAVLNGIRFG